MKNMIRFSCPDCGSHEVNMDLEECDRCGLNIREEFKRVKEYATRRSDYTTHRR